MQADDPRHGTVAGYNRIPCREKCCKLAMARYKKRHEWDRLNGRVRIVPTLGTRRRVQALNRLGWSNQTIAREAEMLATNMTRLLFRSDTMTASVAARIAAAYERLSMTLPPPSEYATRSRRRAEGNGWPPPLAWDDIDDPTEQPSGWQYEPHKRNSSSEYRLEVMREIAERGGSISDVSAYFKLSTLALEKWCDRAGERPLFNTLNRREHTPTNYRNQYNRPGDAA